jgi:hypothetical protein
METSDYNERMIAYLYGEMSGEEKKEFEGILDINPDLKKDMEELKGMKEGLSGLEDKEIMEPYYMWKNRSGSTLNRIINPHFTGFRYVAAIAASVMILILTGYLLKVDIRYQDSTLAISFLDGKPIAPAERITQEEITRLVRNEIARNNTVILSQFEESENNMLVKLASLETTTPGQEQGNVLDDQDRENIETLLARLNTQNVQTLQSYIQLTSSQQQQSFQEMLTGMSEYIEYQREEDLRRITRGLQTLKETQDQQKVATDRMFADIVSNVNYQNN